MADVKESGTVSGAIHRTWGDLKAKLGAGDHGLLETAEQGEDEAKKAYEKALDHDLPLPIRELLVEQQEQVLTTHDFVKASRDASAAKVITASQPFLRFQQRMEQTMRLGRALMAVVYVTAGAGHFIVTRAYVRIMPDYLPAHRELVLISGAAEIAGGLGLFFPPTRRAAAYGIILLLIAVLPANLWMAQHPRALPRYPTLGFVAPHSTPSYLCSGGRGSTPRETKPPSAKSPNP